MSSLPKTFTAASFEEEGTTLTLVEKELKKPGKGQLLVKVIACGICHSDAGVGTKALPVTLPLVPGHEIVGEVVAVGDGVTRFQKGARVGGAWHGGKKEEVVVVVVVFNFIWSLDYVSSSDRLFIY